jgi:DNA-binding NarL/FixJ family response regulator
VIDPQIVDGLLARWNTRSRSSAQHLTEREYEVLAQMAQGKSNSAIALTLGVSESAVEKHINALLAKLGLEADDSRINRRVAAVLRFLRSDGLVGGRG